MRSLLHALTQDPDEATPMQRLLGGLVLIGLLIASAVRW